MTSWQWADFIVNKLGLPYTKAEVMRYADYNDDESVWDHFIASNEEYLHVAKANRIEDVFYVYGYYEERGYAEMRSTFPKKSHGRSVLGPRIISLKMLREKEAAENKPWKPTKEAKIPLSELIGTYIIHDGSEGLSFGRGEIVAVSESNGSIAVQFDDGTFRQLQYRYCLENRLIRFERPTIEDEKGGSIWNSKSNLKSV